ncbi:CSS-motif domain-containing protein [Pseudomonas gingeri]
MRRSNWTNCSTRSAASKAWRKPPPRSSSAARSIAANRSDTRVYWLNATPAGAGLPAIAMRHSPSSSLIKRRAVGAAINADSPHMLQRSYRGDRQQAGSHKTSSFRATISS